MRWQRQLICNKRVDGLPAGACLRGVHARARRSGLPRPAERRDLHSTKADRGALAGPRFLSANKACAHLEGPGMTAAQQERLTGQALKFAACMRAHGITSFQYRRRRRAARVGWGPAPAPIRRGSGPRSKPAGRSCLEVGRERDRFFWPGCRAGRGGRPGWRRAPAGPAAVGGGGLLWWLLWRPPRWGRGWRACSAESGSPRRGGQGVPDLHRGGGAADAGVADPGERDAGVRGLVPGDRQGWGTLTWLPPLGRVIRQGAGAVPGRHGLPVVLLYGKVPAWRTLAAGMTGPDVRPAQPGPGGLGYASAAPFRGAGVGLLQLRDGRTRWSSCRRSWGSPARPGA